MVSIATGDIHFTSISCNVNEVIRAVLNSFFFTKRFHAHKHKHKDATKQKHKITKTQPSKSTKTQISE